MYPESDKSMKANLRTQSGFSIAVGIFLLVIIAGLGVFMLSIYSTQQSTSSQDVQGTRAYHAARSGIEWGSYQILSLENSAVTVAPYTCAGVMGSPTFSGALQNFSVTVSCSSTATTEGGNTIRVYQITSTASFGAAPSPDFVERQVIARVATCRVGPGTAAVCS